MTDRELLELAAKAAGYIFEQYVDDGAWVYPIGDVLNKDGEPAYLFYWNPLDDDGDALRLAVNLGATLVLSGGRSIVYMAGNHSVEYHGDDPCAATRRAIVRAAAEIGKGMQATASPRTAEAPADRA
jgi:hypothetical protein